MDQNSFQKNGMLRINSVSKNNDCQTFGRRTVQEIRDDLFAAKTKNRNNASNKIIQDRGLINFNNANNHKQNVENLRNLNRWK